MDLYRRRVEAFGCFPIVIDGTTSPPSTARTQRTIGDWQADRDPRQDDQGKGFSEIENKDGWHGKALPPDMAERAIKELGGIAT